MPKHRVNTARFFKYVWPYYNMNESVKAVIQQPSRHLPAQS